MTRRGFAASIFRRSRPAIESDRVPTRDDEINPFADQFNLYVKVLQEGILDLKQWDRVKRAWERMTGSG